MIKTLILISDDLAVFSSIQFHDTMTAGIYDENFLLGTPINFNTNDRKVIKQRNALAALVEYNIEGKPPSFSL